MKKCVCTHDDIACVHMKKCVCTHDDIACVLMKSACVHMINKHVHTCYTNVCTHALTTCVHTMCPHAKLTCVHIYRHLGELSYVCPVGEFFAFTMTGQDE